MKQLNDVLCTSKKELVESKGNINKQVGLTIEFSCRYDPKDFKKKW